MITHIDSESNRRYLHIMTKSSNAEHRKYPEMIAAVDLGSNSFHLIVARVDEHGNFSMVDQMKEMVRLRGGLDEYNNMDEAVAQNALESKQQVPIHYAR